MRLRFLVPCALLGVASLTSCNNSRTLVAPNRQPIYRAVVVEEAPTQIAQTSAPAGLVSASNTQMANESISRIQDTQPQVARASHSESVVRTGSDPTPAPSPVRVVPVSAPPKPAITQVKAPAPAPVNSSPGDFTGGVVRTTAYTHTEADSLQYGKKNAAGGILKYGRVRSAAADWSVYPVGTIFRMEGDPNLYEIDDYGSALVGSKTIDIYKPSMQSMNDWGVRHVPIKVVRWGCFAKSLEIMQPRVGKAEHVRQMVKSIQSKDL